MSKGLSLKLAWRFLRSRRYGPLSRFMSLASTAGIAIGVMALIVGLSAMNGFERELENRVLSIMPAGTLTAAHGFADLNADLEAVRRSPGVKSADPCVSASAVLQGGTSFVPVQLFGIADDGRSARALDRFATVSSKALFDAHADVPKVILGSAAAQKLNVKTGDHLNFIAGAGFDDSSVTELEIAGIFSIGGQLDAQLCFTSLNDAVTLAGLEFPNVIEVEARDLLEAPEVIHEASAAVSQRVAASSWMETQGKLYNDIQMIRGIMYLAMILVMGVASFNIISNLVMSVAEKSREIAVLKTLGAGRGRIVRTFTLMGLMEGMRGTAIGAVLGCVISLLLTPIMRGIERLFGFKFLNPEVYFIDFIPSRLELADVTLVVITALVMSALASLYPAIRAAKVEPARELNV